MKERRFRLEEEEEGEEDEGEEVQTRGGGSWRRRMKGRRCRLRLTSIGCAPQLCLDAGLA